MLGIVWSRRTETTINKQYPVLSTGRTRLVPKSNNRTALYLWTIAKNSVSLDVLSARPSSAATDRTRIPAPTEASGGAVEPNVNTEGRDDDRPSAPAAPD